MAYGFLRSKHILFDGFAQENYLSMLPSTALVDVDWLTDLRGLTA